MNYFNCVPYSTDWFERSSAEVGHEHFLGRVHVLLLQIFYLYIFIYLWYRESDSGVGYDLALPIWRCRFGAADLAQPIWRRSIWRWDDLALRPYWDDLALCPYWDVFFLDLEKFSKKIVFIYGLLTSITYSTPGRLAPPRPFLLRLVAKSYFWIFFTRLLEKNSKKNICFYVWAFN